MTENSLFFRLNTDRHATPVHLENAFAGPQSSACWLIGGGPSLDDLPCEAMARSLAPKMTINLAGTRKLRPTFWTAYDPTVRFLRSIYLDPSVIKFVPRCRAMDLVPETNFKVCECPGVLFFERDPGRSFRRCLDPLATGILDWADTFMQAVDLLFRLGFRRIYLAGCEFHVRPSPEQQTLALKHGVRYEPRETLKNFVRRCDEAGLMRDALAAVDPPRTYHFDEQKSFAATIQTDEHYYRMVQALRLSRQCLTAAGVELISVTPESRLNEYFSYQSVAVALATIVKTVGCPETEATRGLYTQQTPRWPETQAPMVDIEPPRSWRGSVKPVARLPMNAADNIAVVADQEGWQRDPGEFAEQSLVTTET